MPQERSNLPLTVGTPFPTTGARYRRAVDAVAAVIAAALEAQAPADLVVARRLPVHFPTGLVRTPDVVVARSSGGRLTPDEVLLAVEVEPTDDDRTSSPAVYGEHGVPHVWRVSPDPPTIRVFALRDGVHQQVAASAHVIAHAPFRLQVDLTPLRHDHQTLAGLRESRRPR